MLETDLTSPIPILFHPLKHHLGYLQHFIPNSTEEEMYNAIPRIGLSPIKQLQDSEGIGRIWEVLSGFP